MIAKPLPRQYWHEYFDHLSYSIARQHVDMRFHDRNQGVHTEADWIGQPAITYDAEGGRFSIAVDGLCQGISPVREIFVSESGGRLAEIDVIDWDGRRHSILFSDPSAPAGGGAVH